VRLTSPQNPVVKYVRSLERASMRREERSYLIEGVRLVSEAITTGQQASIALYDPALLKHSAAGSSLLATLPDWAERSYEVDERVLTAAAQTEHPAGILAVLPIPKQAPLATHADDSFGIILDKVGDPGNAGTILRTADAAGVGYVIALPGTVDVFSPKVVRAGMGAHFHLPLYTDVSLADSRRSLPAVSLVASDVADGTSLYRFDWPVRAALIVGSEAHGLSPDIEDMASFRVHIPMRSGVESLNAAVAASIMIYTALGPNIKAAM
jgi:TrmH family RNA methyltransferase